VLGLGTPEIPATQGAEIRRIMVQGWPRQNVSEIPSQQQAKHGGMSIIPTTLEA
jgi:hypothetical protein